MDSSHQEKRFLQLIEDYQKKECHKVLLSADAKVSNLLRKAFHKAREYVHTTIIAERQRSAERIHAAQAELRTQKRQHMRKADEMILKLGRKRIKQQLLNDWQNSSNRQIWISKAIHSALERLPHEDWQIHHPLDWLSDESQKVIEMTRLHRVNLFFYPDAAIKSGIKITVAATVLDMTEQGILADKRHLESRLLALFYQVSSL